MLTGNVDVCATESYTIQYVLNGGSNDSANPQYYTEGGEEITLKDAKKIGYSFAGWYLDSGFQHKIDTISADTKEKLILYAKFKAIHYNITFVMSGGSMDALHNYSYTIESDTMALPEPQQEGYAFAGWYDNASYAGSPVSVVSKGSYGQKTFYAKWNVQQYAICYYTLDGSLENSSPGSYNITSDTIVLADPVRAGYTFGGWYESMDFKTPINKIPTGSTGNRLAFAKWKKVSVAKVGKVKLKQAGSYLNISYPKVSKAKGYEITYYKKGKKDTAKTISLNQLAYTLLKCKPGATYCVKVRAFAYDSCNQRVYGKYSKVYKCKMSE